ncbi:MAG: hypothetical protein IJW96_04730, partial [Clostridia bacterium]|nr:hypothetical protein [Clostridia bacterium]
MKKITKTILIGWISLVFAIGFTGCTLLNFAESCEHTYDNACDITCNECGETRAVGAHDFNAADCDTPKTCKVCGKTEGTELGHSYTQYVYDDHYHYDQCSLCGTVDEATREAHTLD